jgi:hypothetical protein
MFCYWEPEEGMGSSIHIFYDDTADANLDMDSLYTLTAGMVKMFDQIAQRNRGQ